MSSGRSNRPLFDLLDGARSKPRVKVPARPSVASPEPHVEIKPRFARAPRVGPGVDAAPRLGILTKLRLAVRPFLGESTMTLPANAVYYSVAVIVLAVVFAWVIGYRLGEAKRAKELAPFTKPDPLQIQEPTAGGSQPSGVAGSGTIGHADPGSAGPGTTQTPQHPPANPQGGQAAPVANRPASVEVSSTPSPTSETDVFLPLGWTAADPREVGLNYLYFQIMARNEAELAVKFLSSNGLEALAVPLKVDRSGSRGNNPPPADAKYRVVLRRGLTGDEFREGTAKQSMQAAAQRLGLVWKRDHRGTTDFSASSWEKLVESR